MKKIWAIAAIAAYLSGVAVIYLAAPAAAPALTYADCSGACN
jgi:hypothetical protein